MPSRALRCLVAVSILLSLVGTSVSQASPGNSGEAPGQVISGRIEVLHADPLDQDVEEGEDEERRPHIHGFDSVPDHVLPGLQYWLETDSGEVVLLEFPGTPPPATTGQQVRVRGESHGRAFHVSDWQDDPVADSRGGGGSGKTKPSPNAPSFVGKRDMIVIPITFAGNSTPLPATREQIREAGFVGGRSVRTYYEDASGTTSPPNPVIFQGKNDGTIDDPDLLPGDVTQTYEVNVRTDICDHQGWADAAKAAASNDWDLTGYEHIVYLHPRLFTLDTEEGDVPPDEVPLCKYSGRAVIGGTESWLNGTTSVGVWAHELGHNLTLWHSRTWICRSGSVFVAVGGTCTYDEYGDPFDNMGNATALRHYHARNKAHMGWIPAANIKTVSASGDYLVQPIETAVGGTQVLQIPRGRSGYLYVDVRKIHGQYDNYAPGSDALTGALIRSGPAVASNGNSYLFDTAIYPTRTITYENQEGTDVTEVVPDFRDAALQVGQGFVDTASGVYIEPLRFEGDALWVRVGLGVTNGAPSISPGETSSMVLPGQPVQHQGASAADVNKNLGMYRWAFKSCPGTCPTLTGAEGALAGGSSSIPGAVFTPVDTGTYVMTLTVWDTSGAMAAVDIQKTAGI